MRSLFLIVVAAGAIGCRDHNIEQPRNIYCGVEDPVTELQWLRTDLQQYEHSSAHLDAFLYTAIYHDNRIFYVDICCPACTTLPPEVKNCDGTVLGRLGDGIDPNDLTGQQILWRTLNGVCTR